MPMHTEVCIGLDIAHFPSLMYGFIMQQELLSTHATAVINQLQFEHCLWHTWCPSAYTYGESPTSVTTASEWPCVHMSPQHYISRLLMLPLQSSGAVVHFQFILYPIQT